MDALENTAASRGISAGLGAFLLWGLMPLFWLALRNIPAFEVLLLRILCSFVFVLIMLLFTGGLKSSLKILKQPKNLGMLFIGSTLLAGNWLMYIWAIQAGYVLETSLGYFINPLINVILAFIFLRERPSRLAWFAIALATCGVAYQIMRLGEVPLIALWLAGSFAFYGLVHKVIKVEAMPGLCVETLLHVPTVLAVLVWLYYNHGLVFLSARPVDWLMLVSTGPITTIPLIMFTFAAQRIPLTTIGLLQYIAPSIVFILGVTVLGESLTFDRVITFGCIWLAIAIYSFDLASFQRQVSRKAN